MAKMCNSCNSCGEVHLAIHIVMKHPQKNQTETEVSVYHIYLCQ